MPEAFSAKLAALFANPSIGRDAVYITDGAAPVLKPSFSPPPALARMG